MAMAWRCALRGGIATPSRVCSMRIRAYAAASSLQSPSAARTTVAPIGVPLKDAGLFTGVVAATRQFHAIHGHFVIPAGFRVPKLLVGPEDEGKESPASLWPPQFRGYPLGFKLKALLTNPKHRLAHEDIVDELRSVGMPVDNDWREFLWQHTTLKGLKVYKEIHGDLLVPRNFRIPFGDATWPRSTWGFRLGLRVMNMRQQRYEVTPSEADDLAAIGFVWDAHDHVWTTRVLPALQTFKTVYGHCNVEQAFVVPSSAPWPPTTWKLALGNVVNTLRSRMATYAHQVQRDHEILDEIGFAWVAADDRWERVVLPALEMYAQLFGRQKRPSQFYIVPAEEPWPQATWFLSLGLSIYNIRNCGTYRRNVLRDAKRLQEIGWLDLLTELWDPTTVDIDAVAQDARDPHHTNRIR